MKMEQAVGLIENAMAKMRHGFGKPVFDEWILFTMRSGRPAALEYAGPRLSSFEAQLSRDARLLADELREGDYRPGHFYFTKEGEGQAYDAFMAVGQDTYLILNNTVGSMASISADPMWRDVQVHVVHLSERFRANPLEL